MMQNIRQKNHKNNETISILSLFDIDLSTANIAKYNTRCYPLNNLFVLADIQRPSTWI